MRAAAVCAAVLLPVPDAVALTLGRIQGAALLGRPLQVSVPVLLQPGEDITCVRAELQQPELPVVPLNWHVHRTEAGATVLRLSSAQPVQEPVITVRLVVGCGDQFTQGYVMLADPPPAREVVPAIEAQPVPAPASPSAAAAARSAPAPARAPARTVTNPEGLRWETTLPARSAAAAPVPAGEAAAPKGPAARTATDNPEARAAQRRPARAAPKPAASPAPAAEGEGRARLQVDLLDIAIDQAPAPALKAATEMARPGDAALSRAEAEVAWQQINSPPEQQLSAAAQAQFEAVQAELKALREQTRLQAELLQKMQEERNLARDIAAGGAGAIALGLLVLLWRRSRETASGRPWWQKERVEAKPAVAVAPDSSFVDSSFPEEDEDLPVRIAPEPDSGWSAPRPVAAGRPASAVVRDSTYGRSRLPSAEELLDVQEKANFFLAIGQPEKAIELLESRLLEHLGSSPFLWLDLLDLCRKLDRQEDYERVRKEFQRMFAARMPSFEEAEVNSEGLERYPKALSRIELLWPSSKVLKEIEKSLFQDPAPGSIMFDLEASRDLLLLYSVALEVVSSQEDGSPYDRTQLGALDDDESPHTTEPVPLMALDSESGPEDEPVDLDLDFSMLDPSKLAALSAEPEPVAQAPVPDAPPAEPEPTPPPHEIEWEAPELPQVAAQDESQGSPPAEEPAMLEPMLPELDLAGFAPKSAEPTQPRSGALAAEAESPLQSPSLDAPDLLAAPPAGEPSADNGIDFNLDIDLAEPDRTSVK